MAKAKHRGPVARGAVVKVHGAHGIKLAKGIVVGVAPATAYSRAYGKQIFVCKPSKSGYHIHEVGAHDSVVVGKVKKVPKACRTALAAHKRDR